MDAYKVKQVGNSDLYADNLEPFPIDGLSYFANFLSAEEQAKVVRICDSNPWVKIIRRRQQFYGEVYYHTTRPKAELQPKDHPTPSLDIGQFDWLRQKFESDLWKQRVFQDSEFPTQILVNEYEGMAGISSHFEDENSFGVR